MNLQKVSNKEKIETIISKCKNQDLKYTTDLYEKIVFLDYNKNNSINVYEEPTIQDLKFISIRNLDENLKNFKNYKLFKINDDYGFSFGFSKKEFFKPDTKKWDIISQNIAYNGGKFYIDIPCSKIITLNQKEFKEFYEKTSNIKENELFKFKGMQISSFSKPTYSTQINSFDMIVHNENQILLTTNLIKDFFYELDKENFVDVIAFKYFPSHLMRKDKLNFYISKNIKNSSELIKKFASLLKNLVKKYQKLGLKFNKNTFIMPYDFDKEDRIIANVFISESFNRSLAYFLLLYINPTMNILHNFKYDNFTSNCNLRNISNEDLEFVKICQKNLDFENFIYEILSYFKECNYQDYIKTYRHLFKY